MIWGQNLTKFDDSGSKFDEIWWFWVQIWCFLWFLIQNWWNNQIITVTGLIIPGINLVKKSVGYPTRLSPILMKICKSTAGSPCSGWIFKEKPGKPQIDQNQWNLKF